MTYRITPDLRKIVLRGRFLTPVSHHDPAQADKSNISLFLRQKQFIDRRLSAFPDADTVRRAVAAFPVPEDLAADFATFTPAQFIGIAAVRKFIRNYNGLGILDGTERYRRLEDRVKQNAIRHTTLYAFWGGLCRDCAVGAAFEDDAEIETLLTLHPALAQLVLADLASNSSPAVTLARIWNDSLKANASTVTAELAEQDFQTGDRIVAEVPSVSANAVRHKLVREPGALHLLTALGIDFADLNDGVAALLYNGGDLNESEPSDAFKLIRQVREAYPLLGLVGGATKGFILGASNVETSAWLVCRENNDALAQFGIAADVSAFDMLDRAEMTRHTSRRVDGSPMPFGFESLAQGSEILVEFRLRPYATDLELGALLAALETYAGADSVFGGQSARGFGLMALDWLQAPPASGDARDAYETYVREHERALRDGLLTGTLGTHKVIC